ncbi:MAG: hypothetical protein HZY73_01485 [Micropruina sp.]|nr:MAG: hypothetical protein HZY73_01485 [Micropruina sp.]
MQSVSVLSPRPPVRALLIAAGAALVGALLVIGSGVFGWPGFLAVTGALVLVLGCVLGSWPRSSAAGCASPWRWTTRATGSPELRPRSKDAGRT